MKSSCSACRKKARGINHSGNAGRLRLRGGGSGGGSGGGKRRAVFHPTHMPAAPGRVDNAKLVHHALQREARPALAVCGRVMVKTLRDFPPGQDKYACRVGFSPPRGRRQSQGAWPRHAAMGFSPPYTLHPEVPQPKRTPFTPPVPLVAADISSRRSPPPACSHSPLHAAADAPAGSHLHRQPPSSG